VKPPSSPPPLTKMSERTAALEKERRELFEQWKAALEAAGGNVSRAAETLGATRDRGNYLVRRLGLAAFAAELRLKTTGKDCGRPRSKP